MASAIPVYQTVNRWSGLYLLTLGLALAGYAVLGKTFAYIGYNPLFIGEIVLLLGFTVFLRANRTLATLALAPSFGLALMMGWVLLRTLPFIGEFGVDALRDSVIIMYGSLAFIIIALMLEDARRLNTALGYYRRFTAFYVIAMPLLGSAALLLQQELPQMPGTGLPILSLRPGDLAVHLAGAAVFVLVGLRRPGKIWVVFLLWGAVLVATQNRGAMLAMIIPVTIAALLMGRAHRLLSLLIPFAFILAVGYAMNIDVQISDDGRRMVGPRQLVDNMASIFGSTTEELDGTKEWRLDWWQTIYDYTVNGQYFWTGKGSGVNLAVSDGFVVGTENPDAPPLRSPHNASLTILARYGIPGFCLWVIVLAVWFATLADAMLVARRRGQADWSGLFLFIACYELATLINSSFDVALEGPILGFWFWSLFGFGVSAVMIYRLQPPPDDDDIASARAAAARQGEVR